MAPSSLTCGLGSAVSRGADPDALPATAHPAPPRWMPTPAVRASFWLHGAALPTVAVVPSCWPWMLGLLAVNHALLGGVGMRPRSRLLGPNLSRLPRNCVERGEVALTFDDGPDPEVTPRVLDLLDASGASASFFVIGARAEKHPGLVRDILSRGHSVENHTQTHPLLFAAWHPRAQRDQIEGAQASIRRAGGEPRFFRPPAGLRSPLFDPVLAGTGLRYVSWTRRGADALIADPERVGRRLLRGLAAGDVLLLHDGNARRGADRQPVVLAVLPRLLGRLAAEGLKGVSLPRALFTGAGVSAEPAETAASPESAASAGRASP